MEVSLTPTPTPPALRPWQRLAVRLASVFVLVTLVTVGVVGVLVHQRQSRAVEDTVGTQLLNIARVSALLIDPAAYAEAAHVRRADAPAYRRVTKALTAIRDETLLTTPMRTLTDYDRGTRRARIVVTTAEDERPGEAFVVGPEAADAVAWTFEDGVARYTGIYRTRGGMRISAFAPILDARGGTAAVLEVDYPVDFYFDRLRELDTTIALGSLAGVLLALILAVVLARRLTRPVAWRAAICRRRSPSPRATRSASSRARSTPWSRACASARSSATRSAATSRPRSPEPCWSRRAGSRSGAASARSPC